jgi:metal-responsive CopG/Arc/MetJ family transcriptional regulator
MTISLRLDKQMSRRLAAAARAGGVSKSELIRRCLDSYLQGRDQVPSAWERGKDLFGCYTSGRGDLSARVKEIVRERIHGGRAKKNRR